MGLSVGEGWERILGHHELKVNAPFRRSTALAWEISASSAETLPGVELLLSLGGREHAFVEDGADAVPGKLVGVRNAHDAPGREANASIVSATAKSRWAGGVRLMALDPGQRGTQH